MDGKRLDRRSLVHALGALCLVGSTSRVASGGSRGLAPTFSPLPDVRPLNSHVLDIVGTYAFGDVNPYTWVPGTHTDGTTRDLQYRGITVARRAVDAGIHCSGITFEVWLRALEMVGAPGWLTAADVLDLKEVWYVRDGSRLGPVGALTERHLGIRIDRLEDLQPGDFVQFWRHSGRGHSAVFVDHRRRRDGSVRGLAFWSAQSASHGIGVRYASMGAGKDQLEAIYGVRPICPVT